MAGAGVSSLALAACGENSTDEASGSKSSSHKSTPSPTKEKKYSGGSKAPDGEYRPADDQGPAQNVQEPPQPPDGYTVPSVDGLLKSLLSWDKWHNYAVQTGDFNMAGIFVSSKYKEEVNYMKSVRELYRDGGWVIDGILNIKYAAAGPQIYDGNMYLWESMILWKTDHTMLPDGRKLLRTNKTPNEGVILMVECYHDGDRWQIQGKLNYQEFYNKYVEGKK